jgi:peptidoglycan/xylan/chitin deacetylase (PgdA/CDA1 family)
MLVLPLSAVPFAAYAWLTPEGRLVKDKAVLALNSPSLPALSAAERARLASTVPEYADAVMPLVYHGIGSSNSGEGGYVVSPDRFAEHLAALRAANLNFVTATDVAEAFAGRRRLPPRAVLLSFDDGRTDAMMFATPLLEQADARATMFVITGAAEEPGVYYVGWDDLAGYGRGPWDLQAHTDDLHRQQQVGDQSLPALTALADGESFDEYQRRVARDLETADATLARYTGRRPVAFAYPFGAYGADRTNDAGIRGALANEIGRRYALAFHQDGQDGIELATAADDRTGLRRLSVSGDWSGEELVQRVAAATRRSAG